MASRKIKFPLAAVSTLIFTGVALLIWRDRKSKQSPNQDLFLNGSIPDPLPEGAYKGSVEGYSGGWLGKTFDARNATGMNLLKSSSGIDYRYPFITWVGRGLADPINVMKIDYDIAGNPVWLRRILDEIVEVGPNHYLGKVHLHLGPMHVTVGYFELRK